MARKVMFSLIVVLGVCWVNAAFAYWIWTPKTGKWVNPRYAAKDNPQEQLDWAMSFYMAKKYPEAIKEFKKLIKSYPNSSQACDSQYFIGASLEETSKFYEAFLAYQKVIDIYPYTQKVEEVIEKEYRIGELYFAGHKDKFLGLDMYSSLDRALEIFQKVVDNAPYGKYAAASQYKVGIILRQLGRFDESKQAFLKLAKNYPESTFAQEAKYQIGLAGYKTAPKTDYTQEETDSSIKEIREFIKINPESPLREDADRMLSDMKSKKAESLYKTAQFYERRKQFRSALIYYEDIVKDFSDTSWAAKSLERISILAPFKSN